MDLAVTGSLFRRLRTVIPLMVCACLFVYSPRVFASDSAPETLACGFSDPTLDHTSDIEGEIAYEAAIRQLLAARKFEELDCVADAARANKSQFDSGRWKLSVLYWAIQEPQGHATEQDWAAYLKLLNRWVSARPKSITARVALADSYTSYAWDARGVGYVDTVTNSGWKLFHERIEKAKTVLEQASHLKAKCPHWYVVMQTVALAEGWDLERETALLAQAVKFEPGYYYYYQKYAHYLRPEWYGAEGDAERFAAQAADHVGGSRGDILYFQIATELFCHCKNEGNLKLMSWPRIQKGVAALEQEYGVSLVNLNLLAYMAVKLSDSTAAHNAFLRIADDWNQELWKTRTYFDSCKRWAQSVAKYDEVHGMIRQAREKFAPAFQQCAQASGDPTSFTLVITLQKEGIVESVWTDRQTGVSTCLTKLKGETLSPPPRIPFVFGMDIDPVSFRALSAK